jgi:ABC-type nitrate/sulfonate/bicarbonate transport system permease component
VTQLVVDHDAGRLGGGTPYAGFWKRARDSRASGVLLVGLLLAIWEASARTGFIESVNWPPFSVVIATLVVDIADGELLPLILSTLWRMLRGYAIGCAIGIPLGFAIALWRPVRMAVWPTIELLRPIPIPAIIPPLIFLLGLGDGLKLTSIAFASLFPVTLNTVAGVLAVEPVYRQVAKTFGLTRIATLWRVVFPASLPFIFAGLRTSLGLAFVVTVVAEMIAGQDGIGYYLMSMQFAMRAADMYAAVILLTFIAYLLNQAFVKAEARVIRWTRLREAMGDAS